MLRSILNNNSTVKDIQLVPLSFVGINEENVSQNSLGKLNILGKKVNTNKNNITIEKKSDGTINKTIIIN